MCVFNTYVHRLMLLCPSKVQLNITSFGKPFPALLEKAGCLCPQQPALSLESTSPALLWLVWLSVFSAPRGLCHCTSGTQKNVLMGQRLGEKVMPVYVTGQCALPGGPLLVLRHHHISVTFQSLRQPRLHNRTFPRPREIHYNLHSHRAAILKKL